MLLPATLPPLTPKAIIEPAPFGKSFLAIPYDQGDLVNLDV